MNELTVIDPAHLTVGAQSPFITGTWIQFAWDSTSLGYFKTCPRLYQYIMIDGYQSKEESIHLRFGIELHSALQNYDNLRAEGLTFDDAVHTCIHDLVSAVGGWKVNEEDKPGKLKNRNSLVRTVLNYLDHFRDDPARTHILADGSAATELSFRFELGYGPTEDQPYLLSGHLDKVVEFQSELYVQDYKTTTTTPGSYYFDQFEPSNQMTLYSLGAQIILNAPIRGVIINAIQILADSNRFVRGFTFRTEDQLDEWQLDLAMHLQVAKAYAEENYWPMNDTACDKFGGCRFRQVCSKSPSVRHIYLNNFNKLPMEERWNPLKSR